ncbi:MAG: hypothetical protein KIT83_04185 [Bryobacterales bacterium]|nr:hypothetical protein [Bryobacterales bacterium]
MAKLRDIFWATKIRRVVTVVAICGLVAVLTVGILVQSAASNWSEDRITELMEERFQSEVEMDNFQVKVFPFPGASADGVRFYHKGRRDVPPLITLDGFSVSTSFWNLFRQPIRVGDIELYGLLIQISRGGDKDGETARMSEEDADVLDREDPDAEAASPDRPLVTVGQIQADGAELRLLPKESFKEPLVYSMGKLRLWITSTNAPMAFETVMTNAKPPGKIVSRGSFGPWNGDEPGESPVSGEYTFKDADLGVFKGISGTLASIGTYEGVLAYLKVKGETDVPDFTVEAGGHPVHLKTRFDAIVDGTSGDTLLEPVEASFLNTNFTAQGGVYQKRGVKGKTVELDVDIPQARIEDLLRFAVKGEMPLQGEAKVKTYFDLPPGEHDIPVRMKLKGNFAIHSATFPDWNIQRKVEELSDRASGEPEKVPDGDVVSDLTSNFVMGGGMVNLQGLKFRVPSAEVALDGSYGVLDESLDFRGTVTMDAKVSEATTGFRSFLAKLVNPFFSKKHAGAVIPIKITGNREDPQFGLAVGGAKKD